MPVRETLEGMVARETGDLVPFLRASRGLDAGAVFEVFSWP